MKLINVVTKTIAIVAVVFTFVSCDNDFNSVGSEIIGDVNFEDKRHITKPIAYSKKFERVQTSNLISTVDGTQVNFHANMLGIYNDPVYGQSTYSILSQAQPLQTSFPISFGNNAVLDSVVLNLPYFANSTGTSQVQVTLEDGSTVAEIATSYRLDSIYGNQPIKLSVYQSNYFLRDFDFDPTSNERQAYYSDDIQSFESAIIGSETPLYVNESYVPAASEIVLTTKDGADEGTNRDRSRVTPRLRVKFSDAVKDKFEAQFLNKPPSFTELSNSNNFLNYFRGIYFKVEEPTNGNGNLVYFNMRGGNITLHYTTDSGTMVDDGDGGTTAERVQATLELGFTNNIINSITTDLNTPIADDLSVQDSINGQANLYLKRRRWLN